MKKMMTMLLLLVSFVTNAKSTSLVSSKHMIDLALESISEQEAARIISAEIIEKGVVVKFIDSSGICFKRIVPVTLDGEGEPMLLEGAFPPAVTCE